MAVADDNIAARIYGVVHCGLSSQPSPSVPELARQFGLADDMASYIEIDAAAARRLVQMVLHQDMAYNAEVMPAAQAAELAERFLAQFGTTDTQFYSNNSTIHEIRCGLSESVWRLGSWDAVTAATFDTGVLVIGARCSGCLWVEDED